MTDVQIHWFSIINSVIVVFFLAGILSMIIIKTLRRDIARYNQEETVNLFNKIYFLINRLFYLGRCC
jgi:transmembrane 9 superfamily protein 2/4